MLPRLMLALKQALSLVSLKHTGASPDVWNPIDEASLKAWWQMREGITYEPDAGVSEWLDSSTNTYDLTQSTEASQPTYSGGILTFDGVDDNLASSQINLGAGSNSTIGVRGDFSSGTGTILGDDESNAFISLLSSTLLRVKSLTGAADFTLASGTFGDGYIVITRDSSDDVNAYYNGVSISAEVNQGGTIKIDNMGSTAGAGGFFDGTISEVQIYTSTSAALTTHVNSRLSTL